MSEETRGVMHILSKLHPGTPVADIYLIGKKVTVNSFSNVCYGLAYFVGHSGEVCAFDVEDINGICFVPTEPVLGELEDEKEV
ncbi:hypothetical protein JOC75_001002 [Metabacillus crassostreae]|uniref:hypothetical protein n=1 Tax=Metabacillus crassostreae TaxID=929098 RepID=UPI001956C437|nr:hypothetical protein [Metabacillus crassostreae]MBM7603032.1 hypothetical protein [Metabacillus crassostreae]